MEIKDYLRVLGKRAWLLIMIPAVAGVVAGLIAVGQPQAFRTTATLQLPRDETTTPAQVAQLVADFQAAADNPNVQNDVSEETAVPVKRIQRVRITQVGDSSQLTMSIQDKRREATESKAVINGLASGALTYLQTPEVRNSQEAVDAADARIEQAQGDIDEADTELRAIYADVRTNRPAEELNEIRGEKQFYERQQAAALADGNPTGADAYQRRIDEASLRILALETVMPEVDALTQQIATAQDTLTTAEEELATATEQLAAANFEPDLTFSAEGQSVVRKTRVVKTAAAAVVAGFPIAIGVVLLLDALQKRRAARPARPEHDDELSAMVGDELELEPVRAPLKPGSPALIGASAGAAGLPRGSASPVDAADDEDDYDDDADEDDGAQLTDVDDELDDDELDDDQLDDDQLDDDELDDDVLDSELDADELVVEAVAVEVDDATLDADELDGDGDDDELEDELDDELEDELDDELDDLDEELDDLDDPDLDDPDLGDDLEDDVEATVASRRRLYDADIDDDLSVDGGPAERNGQSRVWARVPAVDEDFDGDDEAGSDR